MSREDKADRNIRILMEYKVGASTKELAEKYGCSVRMVQVIVKDFREHSYASLYSKPVVETDKYIDGRLSGVTIYTRETTNA